MCVIFLFANGHFRTDQQQLSFYDLSIINCHFINSNIHTKNKVYALVDDDKLSIADVVCKSCIYSKTRL